MSLWRAVPLAALAPYLVHERTAAPYAGLPVPLDDPAIVASFEEYGRVPQGAYLYRYTGGVVIEPAYGYALTGVRTLIPASMPYYWQAGRPLFPRHLRAWAGRRGKTVRERAVISLRDFGEDNYFHFYDDVLGRLALAERCGVGDGAPLVIGKRLYDRPYARAALWRGALRGRRLIVQDDNCYVEAGEIIFGKAMPHVRDTFDGALDLLGVPDADRARAGRVFLTRRRDRGRVIANIAEVEEVCAGYGFEAVDADELTLEEQITLFTGARYVVGIHGAGLVNIMFRRGAPLSLLEIFPPDNIPPHYYWMSQGYGFGYDALRGAPGDAYGAFTVDRAILERKLARLVGDGDSDSGIATTGRAAAR